MNELDHIAEFQLGVTTNIIAIFLLLIILLCSTRSISIKNKKNRSFYLLFGMSCLEVSTHLITTVIQYHNFFENNTLGVIMYSFVFTVNCFYLIAWIIYLVQKLKNRHFLNNGYTKKAMILSIPIILLLILSIVNMFIPVFFSYTNFEYERMFLYNLNTIIPICYLFYGLWLFIKSNRKKGVYLEIPFIELLLPAIMAHILEKSILGLCVIPLGNVVTLIILLFNNMQQNLSVDKLTGLYSRKELFDYLEGLNDSKSRKKTIVGIMLDLNGFKAINDNYGHLVGDEALMEFGSVVRTSLSYNSIGFRYAGDEFVIIVKSYDKNEADNIVKRISDNLSKANAKGTKEYKLSAAFGIATFEENKTINDFIEKMDQRMYQDKITKKKSDSLSL